MICASLPQACASLPMYDHTELRAATNAWWEALASAFQSEGLQSVPTKLLRDDSQALGHEWRDPNLLFSQCCGYDFIHDRSESLQLLATPVYAVEHCDGPNYCSLLMVRRDDPAAKLEDLRLYRCAVNSTGSHSGYNALRYLIAPLAQEKAFFSDVITSASHQNSLQLIVDGKADCATVDCVSFALLSRYYPAFNENLRILTTSPKVPGLPYVTRRNLPDDDVRRMRAGLSKVLDDPALAGVRQQLLIRDVVELPTEAYLSLQRMEESAHRLGYPKVI